MKAGTMAAGVVVALLLGVAAPVVVGQQQGEAQKMTPEQQAMMDAWMKAATPGAAHKALEPMVGSWNVTSTSWQAPGAPPQTATGTSENSWVLGGRFVRQDFQGEMGGMKFEGVGYTGYDNVKKEYVGAWMDTTATALMTLQGKGAPDGKVFNMTSTMNDPVTGKPMKMRTVTRIVDPNKHVFELFGPDRSGKEFKMMELVYTRK